jgi:hypothetical protein
VNDASTWKRELRAAKWVEVNTCVYRAPCGCLYRGPYRAWTVMRDLAASGAECPNDHTKLQKVPRG